MVKCLERLYARQEVLSQEINKIEEDKQKLETEIQEKYARLEVHLKQLETKREALDDVHRALLEAEQTYAKIIQSSDSLVKVLKKEVMELCNSNKEP